MKRKSSVHKRVLIAAKDLQPPTRAHLKRLRALANQPVDTSDIPDQSAALRAGKFKAGRRAKVA